MKAEGGRMKKGNQKPTIRHEPLAVIVLAAGKGTRMKSDLPKVLHQAGGRPLIEWVLQQALQLQPARIVVVTGHQAERVEEQVREHHPEVEFVRQPALDGTGGAVRVAAPLLQDFRGDIVVLSGDVPCIQAATLHGLCKARREADAACAMLVSEVEEPGAYGRVLLSHDGLVESIVEAKDATPRQLEERLVNAGVYCFHSVQLWPPLERITNQNAAGEYYLPDVVRLMRAAAQVVVPQKVEPAEMTGVNTVAELQELDRRMEQSVGSGAQITEREQAMEATTEPTRAPGPMPVQPGSREQMRLAATRGEYSQREFAEMKIFTGNANPRLAKDICQHLNRPLGAMVITRFADGEMRCAINESIRGCDVFIVQPTCAPVNDTVMELLIMCDAFKRASARRIIPIIPYMGYARSDKKVRPREPITAKLVADLITLAGADRVFFIDLHSGQIQGFFNLPVDHLPAYPIIEDYLESKGLKGDKVTVVSPDVGGVARARILAERLGSELAIVAKRRPEPGKVAVIDVIGDVDDQICVLMDDLVDSAGTFVAAADELASRGAREIYAAATHPVLSGDAIRRINDSAISELIVTDTIPIPPEKMIPKITVLSVAKVCAEAILRISTEDSVSTMFESWR